jgi:alkane 1-monooxygenase
MKDLKYLIAYAIPACAIIGILLKGNWSFLTPIFAFLIVPVAETLLPQDPLNLTPAEVSTKESNPFFDLLLYVNLPLAFGIIGYFLWSLGETEYSIKELIGLTFSVGVALGSNGINVAHELGHRRKAWERFLGKMLLLPSLYMHFYIEHNFGHHIQAATKEDPASAHYNQSVYSFWFSSIVGQYISAWHIQKELLKRNKKSFLSIQNDMLWSIIFQSIYLLIIFLLFGLFALFIAFCIAITSVLLLETINYIEHYGLSRRKTTSGRYERVREVHSWNSNHVLGRMMLYELTRHSDHHHRAHKKYQLLEYHEVSPQMPYGYPTSMVISLIPPLWFSLMNSRIPSEMKP